MKLGITSLLANAVALLCVFWAGWLAAHDRSGWFWFLLSAWLTSKTVTISDNNSKTEG